MAFCSRICQIFLFILQNLLVLLVVERLTARMALVTLEGADLRLQFFNRLLFTLDLQLSTADGTLEIVEILAALIPRRMFLVRQDLCIDVNFPQFALGNL